MERVDEVGMHALIIEDEILIALELEMLLGELGFSSCEIADSPAHAVASAIAHHPDLVTADFRIVGGTGIEAVAAIEAAVGVRPVVYVTGNEDMVRGQGWPVVNKPIALSALAQACGRARAAASPAAGGPGSFPRA